MRHTIGFVWIINKHVTDARHSRKTINYCVRFSLGLYCYVIATASWKQLGASWYEFDYVCITDFHRLVCGFALSQLFNVRLSNNRGQKLLGDYWTSNIWIAGLHYNWLHISGYLNQVIINLLFDVVKIEAHIYTYTYTHIG